MLPAACILSPDPNTGHWDPARRSRPALDAYKYVGFEDRFRGSRDAIRERLESYLPLFEGRGRVLDVGCGRGEFLDLLTSRGITARGIDLNHEMAEACRARGLDVTEADAVGYLSTLEDRSLGGIFSAQVVEHLEPAYLLRFLELAFHKLRPGGPTRARDAEPRVLGGVLRQLHPRHHARLATPSRHARNTSSSPAVSPARASSFVRRFPRRTSCSRSPRPTGAAALADLAEAFNAQRREAERTHVHLSRLRGDRRQGVVIEGAQRRLRRARTKINTEAPRHGVIVSSPEHLAVSPCLRGKCCPVISASSDPID